MKSSLLWLGFGLWGAGARAAPPPVPKVYPPQHRSWRGPKGPVRYQPPKPLPRCPEAYTNVLTREDDLYIVRSSDGCHEIIRSEKPFFLNVALSPDVRRPAGIEDTAVELRLDRGAIAKLDLCGDRLVVHNVHDWHDQSMFLVTSKGYVEFQVGYALDYTDPLAYGRERACVAVVDDRKTLKNMTKTAAVLQAMNWGEESRLGDN